MVKNAFQTTLFLRVMGKDIQKSSPSDNVQTLCRLFVVLHLCQRAKVQGKRTPFHEVPALCQVGKVRQVKSHFNILKMLCQPKGTNDGLKIWQENSLINASIFPVKTFKHDNSRKSNLSIYWSRFKMVNDRHYQPAVQNNEKFVRLPWFELGSSGTCWWW